MGSAEFSAHPLFEESTYVHPQNGQTYPMYLMSRDGFSLLVMGFTGKDALKFKLDFIEAFNKMEQELLKPVTIDFSDPNIVLQLAQNWAEDRKKLEAANKTIEQQAPKVAFCDAVQACDSSCLIGEFAKFLRQNGFNTGEKRLFKTLRDGGYLGKGGERHNVPNQRYIEQGLFDLKKGVRSGSNGVMKTTLTTKMTTKGQFYFLQAFRDGRLS